MVIVHVSPVVVPVVAPPIRDGAVAVAGDRIVAVGPAAEVLAGHAGAELVTWPGILLPGLVNAHAHLEYGAAFADLADGKRPFPQWIGELTARRAALSDADWLEQARDGVRRLLGTGTTCVADVATHGAGVLAAAEAGLAGVTYLEAVAADDERWPAQRAALERLLTGAPAGRRVGLSPHTLYTLGTAVFRDVLAMAREGGRRLHPHLAETAAEAEYVLTGTGPFAEAMARFGLAFELMAEGGAGLTPTQHLDALGGLGPDVHVAHGVHADAEDRALLRTRATTVALCPRSNASLGAGSAPVAAYLAEGSPIAVGTDSLASTPSLDLLAELGALRALAGAQGHPGHDLDRRLVEAATLGGARAMGLPDVGRLAPGARADLAAFDVPTSADPYAALVAHGAGACVGTVLAGRVVTHGRVAG